MSNVCAINAKPYHHVTICQINIGMLKQKPANHKIQCILIGLLISLRLNAVLPRSDDYECFDFWNETEEKKDEK